jgi:2-methylisocitrate lyase-like PEP mutase family enzyme
MGASMPRSARADLRNIIRGSALIAAPGVYDALSARLAARAGFPVIYASGGSVVRSMGLPDLGLADLSAMAARYRQIAGAQVPLIADGENGFGNERNAAHAVGVLESTGVAAIHIEDQAFPKKCGAYSGIELVSPDAMTAKLKSALAARRDPEFMIIARTDAKPVEGLDGAIARARVYEKAGADMIFMEGLHTREEFEKAGAAITAPKVINTARPGTPLPLPWDRLAALGYRIAIFPADLQCAALAAMKDCLSAIKQDSHSGAIKERLMTLKDRDDLVDLSAWEAIGSDHG